MITFLIYVYEFYSPSAMLSYSGESSILLFLNLVFHEDSASLSPPMFRDTEPKFRLALWALIGLTREGQRF